jgi:HK97 family phage portal protein
MPLWGRQERQITFPPPQDLIPRRTARPNRLVTQDTAFHTSVVWACLRLRASLISTFPVDVYRRVTDPATGVSYQVECPKPQVLRFPGGPRMSLMEWLYASQMDLDRAGNTFGLITARDGLGMPACIELIPATDVAVCMAGGGVQGYRYKGVVYDPTDVWHERANLVPGLEIGLSPVAYASWALGTYASLDSFIVEFLDNGTLPSVVMKNTARTLNPVQAKEFKDQYRATLSNGDALVMGADWEFSSMKADMTGLNWLAGKQFAAEEICRFFDVPHDLVDVATSGGGGAAKMTYANINQRNLQFLIYNLSPAIARREEYISNNLLANPRYIKFNTDALLRMDALSRHQLYQLQAALQMRTPTEFRELENLPPLTSAQQKELADLKASAAPPTPNAMLNPDQKGLAAKGKQARAYMPIDSVDGSGGATLMADQAHCQECHQAVRSLVARGNVETVLPNGVVSQVDSAAQPCSCPAGCECNPVGMGCLYDAGSCPCCGAAQEDAQPVYTPPGTQFFSAGRSADAVHIHFVED